LIKGHDLNSAMFPAQRGRVEAMHKKVIGVLLATGLFLLTCTFADGPSNFQPDVKVSSASLQGWHTLGDATWQAKDGEIVGTPKAGKGGWLVLDKPYQDIQLAVSFRCSDKCAPGILLRDQKTPDGFKGTYVSLADADLGSYAVTLDSNGNETHREKLGAAAGMSRTAVLPAPTTNPVAQATALGVSSAPSANSDQGAANGGGSRGRGRGGRGAAGSPLHAGDWNSVETLIDADIVHVQVNGSTAGFGGGATGDNGAGFGPIALYVGGAGEVHFKDISYKDIAFKKEPAEYVSPNYRAQRISDYSYAWSAAVADVNHDGIKDIVTGPYYYLGPDYTVRHELYRSQTFSPGTEFALDMVNFAYDFTGDGWPDVLSTDLRPISLYVNPKGESRRWNGYLVMPQVTSEIVLFKDIDGDGKPEVVYGGAGIWAYAKPDPSDPTKPWTVHPISEPGKAAIHGLGVGDVNGDGRKDLITAAGWYEQPPDGAQGTWPFHAVDFGTGGAEMCVYDVNGDGLPDVVTSLAAHGFGLAWYQQKKDKSGNITFEQHMIMDSFSTKNAGNVTFSELHGMACADMDGDGIPDIVVGKRYWSHLDSYTDPDPYGAAVLYIYHTIRDPKAPGGVRFEPELIHNRSGVGSTVTVADLKGDGAMDIITSTNKGTYIFWGKPHKKAAPVAKSAASSASAAQGATEGSGRGR
jgi:hypothetical protein